MKIEVGKLYKTRCGDKVRIYATDGAGSWPIHGAALESEGWCDESWSSLGSSSFKHSFNHKKMGREIVSEWEEPKPRQLAYRNRTSCSIKLMGHNANMLNNIWERVPWLDEPKTVEEHQE